MAHQQIVVPHPLPWRTDMGDIPLPISVVGDQVFAFWVVLCNIDYMHDSGPDATASFSHYQPSLATRGRSSGRGRNIVGLAPHGVNVGDLYRQECHRRLFFLSINTRYLLISSSSSGVTLKFGVHILLQRLLGTSLGRLRIPVQAARTNQKVRIRNLQQFTVEHTFAVS